MGLPSNESGKYIPPLERVRKENVEVLLAHLKLNNMPRSTETVILMWKEILMHRGMEYGRRNELNEK